MTTSIVIVINLKSILRVSRLTRFRLRQDRDQQRQGQDQQLPLFEQPRQPLGGLQDPQRQTLRGKPDQVQRQQEDSLQRL